MRLVVRLLAVRLLVCRSVFELAKDLLAVASYVALIPQFHTGAVRPVI